MGLQFGDTSIHGVYVMNNCRNVFFCLTWWTGSDSANIRRMVIKTAVRSRSANVVLQNFSNGKRQMLGNIKNPPEPFGDIIRTHFRLKARSVSAQLDQWLSQDDGLQTMNDGASSGRSGQGGSANGLQSDIEELKRVMERLQEGGEVGEDSKESMIV